MMAGLLSAPPPARACDFPALMKYQVETGIPQSDRTPPTLTANPAVVIKRGPGPEGCTKGVITSCDGMGSIAITPVVSDDVTAATDVGYRLKVVSGALPLGVAIPSMDLQSERGAIYLRWDDGEKAADHEAFTFTLEIAALDRAGNVSTPTTVTISDGGGGDGGCAIVGGDAGCSLGGRQGAAMWPVAGLLLVVVIARRRGRARRRLSGP